MLWRSSSVNRTTCAYVETELRNKTGGVQYVERKGDGDGAGRNECVDGWGGWWIYGKILNGQMDG